VKKSHLPLGVTLNEAGELLTRLERDRDARRPKEERLLPALGLRQISPSLVRSVLVLGPNARAMDKRRQGDPRLYTPVDLALFRLNLRLRAAGVSPTVARVNVANLAILLAKHWQHDDEMALVIVGLCGVLVPVETPRIKAELARVSILDAWGGLSAGVERVRRHAPTVHGLNRKPATDEAENRPYVSA
jgi:hypothetical protein